MKEGAVGRIGSGRLVYVERVTRWAAYVVSLPEQTQSENADTDFDQRFYAGSNAALALSPFVDFEPVTNLSLSNRRFLTARGVELPPLDTAEVEREKAQLRAEQERLRAEITKLRASLGGAPEPFGIEVGPLPRPSAPEPVSATPDNRPVAPRLEALSGEGLGRTYTVIFQRVQSLEHPTLEEVCAGLEAVTGTRAMCEFHVATMVKLKKLRWV